MPAHILIVEDNATNLELMSYLLAAYGHTITRANDGVEGLDAVAKEKFDLVLADILMPRMDGFEFLAKARPVAIGGPKIVAVTALAMVGDRDRVLQAGFDGYIPKPIDPQTFVHDVDGYLSPERRSTPLRQREAPAAAPRVSAAAQSGHTILVVDDVATNSRVIRAAIEPHGHRVIEARSMQEALDHAQREVPNLVLADVHMPNGTGYDLIRAFKSDSRLAAVPVILLSSTYWHEIDRAHGLALGAEKFLVRPIDPEHLMTEVDETLAKRVG